MAYPEMTPEQIASAWALVNAATEGPWFPGGVMGSGRSTMVYSDDATGSAIADTVFMFVRRADRECAANAAFIAASRELVPQLLTALEAERAKVARLVDGLKQIAEMEVFSMGIGVDPRPTQEAKIASALLTEIKETDHV